MRRAILIASAKFDPDSGIEPLRFPENDVTALESILRSEEFGFDHVSKVVDQANNHVVERLDELMSESSFDDFILIYFSGHGKINATGELFLSCRNTKESRLNSTGLKYRHIMDLLEAHARDRVAIILDCCYAGRAVSGLKGSVQEQVTSALDTGRGIFVLGASSATQTAEERELDGHGVFTQQIIEGLSSGAADVDNDGRISLNDLAKYVRDGLRKKNIGQDPIAAGMIRSGDLILGTNRRTVHATTVSAIRLKIDEARPHLSKSTYRAVEDYLDAIAARVDFGEIDKEQEFRCLRAFAAGGSIEEVIVAFRPPSGSEPRRREEPPQAAQIGGVSKPASPQRPEPKPTPRPPAQPPARNDDRTASALPLASNPPSDPVVDAQPGAIARLGPRARAYAGIAISVVIGVGAIAASVYWFQGSSRGSKVVSPTGQPVTATSNTADDQRQSKAPTVLTKGVLDSLDSAPAAPSKNVFNAPPTSPAKDVSATAPSVKWKLQTSYPANTATALPLFVKRVGELSGGRMQLEQLAAGAVAPAFQLADAAHAGALDLAYGQGTYFYGKHKALALMTAVPFGFTTRDHLAFRRRSDTKAAFDEMITGVLKLNVVALPCGAFGRSGEFWLRGPLRSKFDLVGKKLRFVGLAATIYAGLGSTVNPLPGGEIIPAIDRGLIDGGQFMNPTNDLALGFADVLKYYYYPSSVMPASILDLYINKGKWDAMPPVGRQIIEQACGEAVDAMITEQDQLDRDALAQLSRQKVSVAAVPTAIERDLYAASERVLTDLRRDPMFDKVMRIVDQLRASTLAAAQR